MTIVIGFYEQHALGAGQAIAYAFGPCHVGFTLYNRVYNVFTWPLVTLYILNLLLKTCIIVIVSAL